MEHRADGIRAHPTRTVLTAFHSRVFGWVILALLCVPCALATAQSTPRAADQEVLRQVQADILAKRWDQAQSKLAGLAQRMEGNDEFHFLRAAVLYHGHEQVPAMREIDRAIRIAPRQARYYLLRGEMYGKLGDIAAAERDYRKNIELAPSSPVGVLVLEQLLIDQRRPEDALAVLDQAIQRMPENPSLYFERGRTQEILRRSEDALASYSRAVQLDPKLAAAQVGLGRLYRVNPETLAQSVQHLQKAIALDPRNGRWHYELGLTYLREGSLEAARTELEKAAELRPRDRIVFAALGTAYTRLKMLKKAAEAQQKSFALTQESDRETHRLAQLESNFTRAQSLEFSGRPQEAIEVYQEILKTSPEEPQVFFALARLHLNLHQPKLAEEYIRRAIEFRPEKADYHQLYAMALIGLDHPKEAEAEIRTAILLDPTDGTSQNALGDLLMIEGRVEDAIAAYQRAVQLAPKEPRYRLSLSRAYRRKGDNTAADREFDDYMKLLSQQRPSQQ